jgi:hypothetical protein
MDEPAPRGPGCGVLRPRAETGCLVPPRVRHRFRLHGLAGSGPVSVGCYLALRPGDDFAAAFSAAALGPSAFHATVMSAPCGAAKTGVVLVQV